MTIYDDSNSTEKGRENLAFIESQTMPIGQLLGGAFTIRIPIFQRDYAWKEDNVKELWEDLMESIDSNRPRYFLGPMVFT